MASKALETNIQTEPTTALLNVKPAELTQNQFQLILQLVTAAKETIAKTWKSLTLVVARS